MPDLSSQLWLNPALGKVTWPPDRSATFRTWAPVSTNHAQTMVSLAISQPVPQHPPVFIR